MAKRRKYTEEDLTLLATPDESIANRHRKLSFDEQQFKVRL